MHSNTARSIKQLFLQLRNSGLSFDESFQFFIKCYFDQINFIKQFFPDYTTLNLGDRADMIIWDYIPPTPINANNFWGHYIYGVLERSVIHTIQNGNLLLQDFRIVGEFEKINENIFREGERLSKKFNKE